MSGSIIVIIQGLVGAGDALSVVEGFTIILDKSQQFYKPALLSIQLTTNN